MPTYKADELVDRAFLKHYGIQRKSGRYPYGSGKDASTPARRAKKFFEMVADLEAQGLTKVEVARGLGMTTTQLRDTVTLANNAIRREKQQEAEKLREKGWSATAIGREMGLNESSVRDLLNPQTQERAMILENTVNRLREEVDKGGWVGIGKGTEYYVAGGISKERLRAAVAVLKDEGYAEHKVQIDTASGGAKNKTTVKVLTPPGTTYKDVVTSKELIRELVIVSEDGGRSNLGILPPLSVNPKRVGVLYKEDGGDKTDGVVYVRPGKEDISIGGSKYAQVRIDVGGTHYIKGMAMYKDDLPPGVDLLVSTNKPKGTPLMGDKSNTVLKNQTDDADNPFGAVIKRQILAENPDGSKRVTSAMNILQEEGDWDKWSRTLSSQVLSKQSPKTAEAQLKKTVEKKKQEFDEINALTNPTVKAHLLEKFSDSVDSDAVHLDAAGMPRASYHAILPFNSLKDNEVYAPNFNQGERVALIRYPHGGTFEIPELIVNNRAPVPKAVLGGTKDRPAAKDAIGINHKVAERLSGADFDGDFVMVIPNDDGRIKSTPPLKKLEGFDPHKYKLPDDAPRMTPKQKGLEMGNVSNLITDMTIKGASTDEIARAVKHSMVVIDAEKHHLDYKRSAEEHAIAALKEKYQGRNASGQLNGASTLISRATSPQQINRRKPRPAAEGGRIDRATGKLMYVDTNEHYVNKKGKTIFLKEEVDKLAYTDDARTLLSKNGGTLIERVYADHSNRLKALANQARKEMVNNAGSVPMSPTAKKVFKSEVDQLKADLHVALRNSPRERQAQVIQNAIVSQKVADYPGKMDNATLKKLRAQALAEARTRAGAKKTLVPISERQWEAIQAGAVSKKMLTDVLKNSDIEVIKKYATPKHQTLMGSAQSARARSLLNQGLTQAEVARVLGVSLTTLKKGLG